MASEPKSIEDFSKPQFLEYGKVFVVLSIKKFSWEKELQNEFNISSPIVKKAINILEKYGYIISKDFWSLSLDMQSSIRSLNGGYFKSINSYPKIYTLIQECHYDDGYYLISELIEKAKNHASLNATFQFSKEKEDAHKKYMLRQEIEEKTKHFRLRYDPEQKIHYETPTTKQTNFQLSLKKAVLELKQETLISKDKQELLMKSGTKQLSIFNDQNKGLTIREEINNEIKKGVKYTIGNTTVSQSEFNKKIEEIMNFEKQNKILEEELKNDEIIKKKFKGNRQRNDFYIDGYGKTLETLENEKEIEGRVLLVELGIEERYNSIEEKEEALKKINSLIDLLTTKGHINILFVQRICRNKTVFDHFQKELEKIGNITYDGEDFYYHGKKKFDWILENKNKK